MPLFQGDYTCEEDVWKDFEHHSGETRRIIAAYKDSRRRKTVVLYDYESQRLDNKYAEFYIYSIGWIGWMPPDGKRRLIGGHPASWLDLEDAYSKLSRELPQDLLSELLDPLVQLHLAARE